MSFSPTSIFTPAYKYHFSLLPKISKIHMSILFQTLKGCDRRKEIVGSEVLIQIAHPHSLEVKALLGNE